MSEQGEDYQRTKLKKQMTLRKRGKEPGTGASDKGAAEESKKDKKAAVKKAEPGFLQKKLGGYMPKSLKGKVNAKTAFDIGAFFAAAFCIYKYGQGANDMIAEIVPTEASMRQQMAVMQAQMQAQQ